jgi:hypothetical protein
VFAQWLNLATESSDASIAKTTRILVFNNLDWLIRA